MRDLVIWHVAPSFYYIRVAYYSIDSSLVAGGGLIWNAPSGDSDIMRSTRSDIYVPMMVTTTSKWNDGTGTATGATPSH